MGINVSDFRVAIRIDNSQAKPKLEETKNEIAKVTQELKAMDAAGQKETDAYKQKKAVLDELNKKYFELRKEVGLQGLTYNELRKNAAKLRAQLNNAVPGSAQWKSLQADLKIVDARMRELRGTTRQTSFSLGKLADGFNKYAAIGASAIAAVTGLTLTVRGCVDEFAQMKEAESQVTKYTGMTADEVNELNEEFKKVSTRTSREELNELAGTAGRLGIQAKDDVLEFVDAANMIQVALGEDLGDDAIKNIGKLADMFGDSSRSMKENMLAIGSAVNSVAQNSSAAEPYLVEFTARMGGVAKQAGLAITDVMGFASALDQNMLRSEMASTALSGLIMKIYQDPAKYAKLAGMDVKEFTDTMTTDVNQAILMFLDSLGRLGGMDQMAPVLKDMKLSGAEAAGVISTLAGNVAKVRKEQLQANTAFVEGTSIINEYNVQNNTVQAELDKGKKRFKEIRVELGEKLLPVMRYMISTGSLTVKGLMSIVTVLMKYSTTIVTITTLIGLYTLSVKASIVMDKLKVFWTDKIIVSLQKLMLLIKANPYAALIAAAATIIALYKDWNRSAEKLTAAERNLRDIRQKSAQDIRMEKSELQQMLDIAKDETRSKDSRLAAIKRLNDISPEYLGNLRLETINTKEATAAVNAYVDGLITKQNIENAQNKINELNQSREDVLKNGVDEGFLTETWRGFVFGMAKGVNSVSTLFRGYEDAWAAETMDNMANRSVNLLRSIDAQTRDLEKYIEEQRQNLVDSQSEVLSHSPVLPTGSPTGDTDAFKLRKEALAREQQDLELMMKKMRMNGTVSEAEYQKTMYDIDITYLSLRKKLYDEFGEDSLDIQSELVDKMIAESNRQAEVLANARRPVAIDEEVDEDDYLVEKFKKSIDGRQAILEAQHQAGLISEAEFQDQLFELNKERKEKEDELENERELKLKATLRTVADLAGSFSQLFSALMDGEIQKVESRYDKEIEIARRAGKDTSKLEDEKEKAINDIKKKYADKQFAAAVLQVTATTAVTAMESYKAMAGIPIVGPALGAAAAAAAVIAGAAQIAVAKQQRDAAKGLKSGGYSLEYVEGYTSSGDPNEVAGVIPVHKNEFVANHVAVANPHVKRFLDVFDLAQKDGSIRWMNTTQILDKARTKSGYYQGGYHSVSTSTTTSVHPDVNMVALLMRIITLLETGNANTDKLANSGLHIDVRTIRDGLNKLDKLERNASR